MYSHWVRSVTNDMRIRFNCVIAYSFVFILIRFFAFVRNDYCTMRFGSPIDRFASSNLNGNYYYRCIHAIQRAAAHFNYAACHFLVNVF